VVLQGHLHTYRFCDNVWTFILQDAVFKSEDCHDQVKRVKIVACDSKLLTQCDCQTCSVKSAIKHNFFFFFLLSISSRSIACFLHFFLSPFHFTM
ncbi:hypothetical protein B296_00055220, partial [Ensete ventricosum]